MSNRWVQLSRIAAACVALTWGMLAAAQETGSVVEPTSRLALIIANASYEGNTWSPLKGPRADATAMAARLKELGFEVDVVADGDLPTMIDGLNRFRDKLRTRPGALAWFYYSGHGAQATATPDGNARNYLIPARASVTEESDIDYEALPLDRVIGAMLAGDPLAAVVVLDACRNNALQRGTKSGLRGLAPPRSRENVLIAYAAAAGDVARDGDGGTSPYTAALLQRLGTPGVPVSTTFKDVRRAVATQTGGRQLPETLDRTEFEIVLAPGAPASAPIADTPSAMGALRITATPVATRLYVDGALVGTTPFSGTVTAGKEVELRARADGHEDAVERIRIAPGQTLEVALTLPPIQARSAEELLGPLASVRLPGREAALQVTSSEVTVGQFRRFVDATGYLTDAERGLLKRGCWAHDLASGRWNWRDGASWRAPGFEQSEQHPVVCVSYNDLRQFADWLHQRTGRVIRAPSEAEWQALSTFGASPINAATICNIANVADQTRGPRGVVWSDSLECSDGAFYTARVRSYTPTSAGLFDLDGNVREWTADCWSSEFDPRAIEARVDGQCGKRSVRGGDYQYGTPSTDRTLRSDAGVSFRSSFLGFRLVVEP